MLAAEACILYLWYSESQAPKLQPIDEEPSTDAVPSVLAAVVTDNQEESNNQEESSNMMTITGMIQKITHDQVLPDVHT